MDTKQCHATQNVEGHMFEMKMPSCLPFLCDCRPMNGGGGSMTNE
jgi:hypothetical protein